MTRDFESVEAARTRLADWLTARSLPMPEVNWTYEGDAHVPAVRREEVIVIGFNPGAGRGATAERMSRSERVWKNRCTRLARGFCDRYVLAELVPVSSFDQRALRGVLNDIGLALAAGADMNAAVIRYHRPKFVFQIGLGYLDQVATLYGLSFVDSRPRPEHPGDTLLRHFRMRDATPWIAIRHFAAPGFSNLDLSAIRAYASEVAAA